MSYVFEIDGQTVWSPALRVGALFHRYVQALEQVLGVSAGITEFAADFLVLDRSQHLAFTQSLGRWMSSGHPIAIELARPVLAVSSVMLQRAGTAADVDAETAAELDRFSAAMPD